MVLWNNPIISYIDEINYLCFTAEQANSTVALNVTGTPTQSQSFEYSLDKTNWNSYVPGTTGNITLSSVGDTVYFRGDNTTVSESLTVYYTFAMTGQISGSGSVMTLLDSSDTLRSLSGKPYCYASLFEGCSSLTTAPEIPATVLSERCYFSMFYECTRLTATPTFPTVTTISRSAYEYMFSYCSSLVNVQNITATNVEQGGCYAMFSDCSSLTTSPSLSATNVGYEGYAFMFQNCSSLVSTPSLPATTLDEGAYYCMFMRCTSLTTAPLISATTLVTNCYSYMFYGCSLLNYIKIAYTGNFSSTYFTGWVSGTPSTGNFYYNGSDRDNHGGNAIPNGWTVNYF